MVVTGEKSEVRSQESEEVVVLGFEFVKEFPGGPQPSFPGVLETLPDALFRIRAGRDIEQALVGFRILHNSRSLPVHGQHQCELAFPELFHEIAGPPTEASSA